MTKRKELKKSHKKEQLLASKNFVANFMKTVGLGRISWSCPKFEVLKEKCPVLLKNVVETLFTTQYMQEEEPFLPEQSAYSFTNSEMKVINSAAWFGKHPSWMASQIVL